MSKVTKNDRKLLLFVLLYFVAGYGVHRQLDIIVNMRAVERVNLCFEDTKDIFLCMNQFEPQGWEKLVRY